MPRPVEALPCGSMSTTSVGWPTAASAVPRLMAVVVLPTPPFWLATTRTRGRSGMTKLPDRENDARWVGAARMLYSVHFPVFCGCLQFFPHRLSLEEEIQRFGSLQKMRVAKQFVERR